VAVVDAYDAMTSDRPYRRSIGHEAAVNELIRVAGTQLDPMVVGAFVSLCQKENIQETIGRSDAFEKQFGRMARRKPGPVAGAS
jgi:HD-GYP domain-containing protein (c-di-GMP phosphodiesterase class II)